MQSYQLVVSWKVYIITNGSISNASYNIAINNTNINNTVQFTGYHSSRCNGFTVLVDKQTITLASIANNNTVTFSTNMSIYVAEVLIVAYRCGGIQGGQCL